MNYSCRIFTEHLRLLEECLRRQRLLGDEDHLASTMDVQLRAFNTNNEAYFNDTRSQSSHSLFSDDNISSSSRRETSSALSSQLSEHQLGGPAVKSTDLFDIHIGGRGNGEDGEGGSGVSGGGKLTARRRSAKSSSSSRRSISSNTSNDVLHKQVTHSRHVFRSLLDSIQRTAALGSDAVSEDAVINADGSDMKIFPLEPPLHSTQLRRAWIHSSLYVSEDEQRVAWTALVSFVKSVLLSFSVVLTESFRNDTRFSSLHFPFYVVSLTPLHPAPEDRPICISQALSSSVNASSSHEDAIKDMKSSSLFYDPFAKTSGAIGVHFVNNPVFWTAGTLCIIELTLRNSLDVPISLFEVAPLLTGAAHLSYPLTFTLPPASSEPFTILLSVKPLAFGEIALTGLAFALTDRMSSLRFSISMNHNAAVTHCIFCPSASYSSSEAVSTGKAETYTTVTIAPAAAKLVAELSSNIILPDASFALEMFDNEMRRESIGLRNVSCSKDVTDFRVSATCKINSKTRIKTEGRILKDFRGSLATSAITEEAGPPPPCRLIHCGDFPQNDVIFCHQVNMIEVEFVSVQGLVEIELSIDYISDAQTATVHPTFIRR